MLYINDSHSLDPFDSFKIVKTNTETRILFSILVCLKKMLFVSCCEARANDDPHISCLWINWWTCSRRHTLVSYWIHSLTKNPDADVEQTNKNTKRHQRLSKRSCHMPHFSRQKIPITSLIAESRKENELDVNNQDCYQVRYKLLEFMIRSRFYKISRTLYLGPELILPP